MEVITKFSNMLQAIECGDYYMARLFARQLDNYLGKDLYVMYVEREIMNKDSMKQLEQDKILEKLYYFTDRNGDKK